MNIINQRIADDRKDYFIKKNKILNDIDENTIKRQIFKIFEDKKADNLIHKNKYF